MKEVSHKIIEIDRNLALLREAWMDSKPEKKPQWMAKIDAALDERLKIAEKIKEEDQ